jgi:acyl-CoA reductase-like NAD-dependent aldehyde dehydrogenase
MEPGSEWQKMKPRDRAKILWRLADMLVTKADEIGRIETLDNGKPIFESQFVDAGGRGMSVLLRRVVGQSHQRDDSRPGQCSPTRCEPVGVVGAIVPWDFPLMLAVWKIAPALACGNTVVIKPASNTSLSLLKFANARTSQDCQACST